MKSTTQQFDAETAQCLCAQAETLARSALGWTQILECRLNGQHRGLAAKDVTGRIVHELADAVTELQRLATELDHIVMGGGD